jgi:hypothetical protein
MVDLGIAAHFVRELTEEQFAEPRRRPRRTAAPGRPGDGTERATRASVRRDASAARRHDRTRGRGERFGATRIGRTGERFGATRIGRTLARLANVRG